MNRVSNIFHRIRNKIAFYPTIIAATGIILAFIFMYLEEKHISNYLIDVAPGLVIDNTETARTLLSTLIGGLISLMVFSFSMVMILLNQASSNFSPRVLPGIISDRKHQIVLGLYLAVILYNILILVSIEPTDSSYQTPGFAVLVAIIFTMSCLASFIYFIHHISQSIQVGTILFNVHSKAKDRLLKTIERKNQVSKTFTEHENWVVMEINTTGYFQNILTDDLLKICKEHDLRLVLTLKKGQFVLDGHHGLKLDKLVSNEVKAKIMRTLVFSNEELTGESYAYGFRQISEIGIKAMSPGINDPGTALNSIDYLSELFILLMQLKKYEEIKDDKDTTRILLTNSTFDEVLYSVLATYRPYCWHDIMVSNKLLNMLNTLNAHVLDSAQSETIHTEKRNLETDLENHIENPRDLRKIKAGFSSWP